MKKGNKKPTGLSRFEKRVEERHKRQEAEYGRDEFLFGAADDEDEADVEYDTEEWDTAELAELEGETDGWDTDDVAEAEAEPAPAIGARTEAIASDIVEAEMASLAAEMAEAAGFEDEDDSIADVAPSVAEPVPSASEPADDTDDFDISATVIAEATAQAIVDAIDEEDDFDFYSMSETAEIKATAVADELYGRTDAAPRSRRPKVYRDPRRTDRTPKASGSSKRNSDRRYRDDDRRRDRDTDRRRDRDRDRRGFFGGMVDFFTNMSMGDRLIAVTGVCVLIMAIVAGTVFVNAQTVQKQVDSFASVGAAYDGINVIGEDGINAVVSARSAYLGSLMLEEEPELEEEQPEEEIVIEDKSIQIVMKVTTVQSDLKIKFSNKATDKLISGIVFTVTVTGDNGKEYEWSDENKDGLIYHTEVPNGKYKIVMKPLEGTQYEDYLMPSDVTGVEVTDKIAYKKIDVADEVKSEKEVNVAQEDTAVQDTAVESSLTDTVEWVESTKTLVSGSEDGYQTIDKGSIPDPNKSGRLKSNLRSASAITAVSTSWEMPYMATEGDTSNTDPSSTEPSSGDPSSGGGETPATVTVDSVSLSSTSMDMKVGDSASLTATVSKSDGSSGSVTWSSSDSSVVSVSGGSLSAQKAGTATITATSTDDSSKSASCTITVTEPAPTVTVSSVTMSQGNLNLKVGESSGLSATVKKSDNSTNSSVEWKSSNTDVAAVSGGTVTAKKEGTATITATSTEDSSKSATCTVTVLAKQDIKIEVSPASLSLKVGASSKLGANVSGTSATEVTWASKDSSIATVDKDGNVKGVKAGTTTVTATLKSDNSKTASCTITVTADSKLEVSPASLSLKVGASSKLEAKDSGKTTTDVNWTVKDSAIATVDKDGNVKGVKAGTTTVTATLKSDNSKTASCTITVTSAADPNAKLKDSKGRQVYVKDSNGKYREATVADYDKASSFFVKGEGGNAVYKYTGWQTIDGATYYYNKDGNYVTGEQVIQGAKYNFGSDGHLSASSGTMGIDVSKWNGTIDWNAVRNSGVSYVIIRCGYRGSTSGALIEDPKFRSNIQGAKAAGLSVGAYFFTQAVNEVEAVEEASMAVGLCSGYGLSLPIFLDVEHSGGRADGIGASMRTAVCKAFCQTVRNSGYGAGVYANKTWLTSYINTSQLTGYKIWLAQYAAAPSYTSTRYDYWQYSSKGKVAGISGNVDMNLRY